MVKPGQNMNGLKWDIVIFWQLYTNTVRMAIAPQRCSLFNTNSMTITIIMVEHSKFHIPFNTQAKQLEDQTLVKTSW